MPSNSVTIHRLQTAINQRFGERLLINKQQFYSDKQDRPITVYYVKKAVYNPQKKRNQNIELFSSTSEIQILLFMRDYWYKLNGWDIPQDNEMWNDIKAKRAAAENKEGT